MSIKDIVVQSASDPLNPENNLRIGYEYDKIGQTAAAIGFYVRAAEYGFQTAPLVTYNALLRISLCFEKQGDRMHSLANTLMQAIEHIPTRPEAYFLLSKFYEHKGDMRDAYLWASLGLHYSQQELEPLLIESEYPGEDGLLFEKSVSAWWVGRKNESITLLLQLNNLNTLSSEYKNAIKYNVSVISQLLKPANSDYEYIFGTNSIGNFFMPDIEKDIIIQYIREGKIYDEPIINEFANYVRPESITLDLGANIGQMTVALAKLSKKVYAVEPDGLLVEILHKNLELNEINNYEIIQKAAWDTSGRLLPFPEHDLAKYDSLGSFGIEPNSDTSRKVLSIALDDLGLNNVSLIKVDVQGADLRAMKGLKETILRCKPAILFEHEPDMDAKMETSFAEYEEFLGSIGYKIEKTVSSNNYLALPRE